MNIEERLKSFRAKPNETIREHTDEVKKKCENLRELGYISEKVYTLLTLACEYHDYGKLNSEFQKRLESGKKFNDEKEIGHNILSPLFLKEDEFDSFDDYKTVFYAVLNHHYYVNNFKEMKENMDRSLNLLEEYPVKKVKKRTLGKIEENIDIKMDVLTGLLNKCDYAGSGYYPVEYKNDFLIASLENLNYKWNDLQKYLIENREKNLIVVANTGMGKTEGGLLWIGNSKGFFILPLKTAINSIYERIKEEIVKENIKERVILLHSEAFDFFLSNFSLEMDYDDVKKYFKEGKGLSLPLSISTLDQLFNFVFLYPSFEIKLATLSYSKIVLDEIQAYSPDLLAYIVIGLKRVVEAGGKFAILTATLPPFIRYYLSKDLGEITYETFIQGKDRHSLKVENKKIDSNIIYEYYVENKGKVLVVCNTVRESQKIYDELLSLGLEKIEVELLHSKYIRRDRASKEKDILSFGKTDNIGDKIWISTSLVEASLDIDFDFLFTELNDLSGLFQRLGRVNRKGVKEIPKYNAYVYTEIDSNLFINGERGFIDRDIFNLSKEALSEVDGLISEEDKYNLIEKYLTFENVKNSSFNLEFKRTKEYMENIWRGKFTKKEMEKKFRNIISYKAIPLTIYNENREKIEDLLKNFNNEIGEKKEEAKREINSYTISIGIYEKGVPEYVIRLEKEEILIVDGSYSYEKGFERSRKNNREKEEVEIDNFF